MVEKSYEKYRWFFTSSGKLVIGGKSSMQNEEIISFVERDDVVMHTETPGSPFCIVKSPNAKDLQETAVFTACFSHEWKKQKKKSEVHVFKGDQIKKKKGMKQGTFGIIGSINKKKVELKLALDIQARKLRAVPLTAAKKKLAIITPGTLNKEQATIKIMKIMKTKHGYPVSKEEVMSAIPSDNIEVKER
jgi:hypothetical protein